jgi:hypothetical protein
MRIIWSSRSPSLLENPKLLKKQIEERITEDHVQPIDRPAAKVATKSPAPIVS